MSESLKRIQANEREIAELRTENERLCERPNWLTNLVSRLSQRIEVIENVSHIVTPQRNAEICGMDETKQRVV